MTRLTIRHAAKAYIYGVMEILDIARRLMWSVGSTSQWSEGYPSRETIERDVDQGNSYVCRNGEGIPVATFCFAPGPDATYPKIEDGIPLDSMLTIHKDELDPMTWSPMREEHNGQSFSLSIRSLLRYSLVQSDDNASNILFERLVNVDETDIFI